MQSRSLPAKIIYSIHVAADFRVLKIAALRCVDLLAGSYHREIHGILRAAVITKSHCSMRAVDGIGMEQRTWHGINIGREISVCAALVGVPDLGPRSWIDILSESEIDL
jgi:hypothetical protein